jgi:transposase
MGASCTKRVPKKGHKYPTLVYQLGARRPPFVGEDRTAETFCDVFDILGSERSLAIRLVASDMWRAFISVVQDYARNADRIDVGRVIETGCAAVHHGNPGALRPPWMSEAIYALVAALWSVPDLRIEARIRSEYDGPGWT